MTAPAPKRKPPGRDYILLLLNLLIVLALIGSVALTVMGQQQIMMVMAGPMGLLVLLATARRRKR